MKELTTEIIKSTLSDLDLQDRDHLTFVTTKEHLLNLKELFEHTPTKDDIIEYISELEQDLNGLKHLVEEVFEQETKKDT